MVTIQGAIEGLTNDSILLYSTDEWTQFVEKIEVKEGKFSFTMPIDTLTEAMLVFHRQQTYPIYLNKGNKISIKGDTASTVLQVKGNRHNKELTQFYAKLDTLSHPTKAVVKQEVEEFIRSNQTSPASIYLLRRYFVEEETPNFPEVKRLISYMDGILQDKPYIERLNKYMEEAEKAVVGKSAPTFSLTDSKGKRISRSDHRSKVILLHFWASWSDSCKTVHKDLRQVYKTYSKLNKKKEREMDEKFAMLGISLDLNKSDWEQAIQADTLEWPQACEFKGWETGIAIDYFIESLPYTVLIGADGKVVARNLQGEELTNLIKKLVEKEKEKERERNKKKK